MNFKSHNYALNFLLFCLPPEMAKTLAAATPPHTHDPVWSAHFPDLFANGFLNHRLHTSELSGRVNKNTVGKSFSHCLPENMHAVTEENKL
jgi:hypothetical protein